MENVAQENEKAISGAIKIDEKEIRTNLDGLVRQLVEGALNALLNAKADATCRTSTTRDTVKSPVLPKVTGKIRNPGVTSCVTGKNVD